MKIYENILHKNVSVFQIDLIFFGSKIYADMKAGGASL